MNNIVQQGGCPRHLFKNKTKNCGPLNINSINFSLKFAVCVLRSAALLLFFSEVFMIEKVKEALRKVEQKDVLSELTEIEINTEDEEVYNACLEIRNQLVPDNYSKRNPLRWDILQAKDEQIREEDCDSERKEAANGTAGELQE